MIIWLASYPKSGNTWLRLFLESLIFNEEILDINNIKISQFPQKRHFEGLIKNFDDLEEVSKNYINVQNKINLDNKIKFFKTHSAYWKAYNTQFTDEDIPYEVDLLTFISGPHLIDDFSFPQDFDCDGISYIQSCGIVNTILTITLDEHYDETTQVMQLNYLYDDFISYV